jgi:uncharacterized Zn finger protein
MDAVPLPSRGLALALAGRRFLLCDACGRADEVTRADLRRHARDGWPRCCGEVMDYFMQAPPPNRTPPARSRCPSCGRVAALTFPAADSSVRIVCLMCALSPAGETNA